MLFRKAVTSPSSASKKEELAFYREALNTSVEPEDTKGSGDSRFLHALTYMSPSQF